MTMPKAMKALAVAAFLLTLLFSVLHCKSAAITCATICYHFAMRLAVGHIVNCLMHNRADHTGKWFQLQKWEHGLYKKLKVRVWKNKLPSYDPELFDITKHTLDEIVQAMCQAEIVHEIIVPLSFLPLLGAICFGDFAVFFITSLLSACFDLCFVIMQRYNRPRLVKLLQKTK